ncbi:hypothetical protein VTL71DRAFT_15914 [Oculimacula yallundae]|uniref:Uncharacterized protein n=1 Tax=Oculimacula yallundae TaxID=86028 RepID=A0ABR4CD12_9HELO
MHLLKYTYVRLKDLVGYLNQKYTPTLKLTKFIMKANRMLVLLSLTLVERNTQVDQRNAVLFRDNSAEDNDDVIYTDYKRSAQPKAEADDDDDDVIYTNYKRNSQPDAEGENDDDVIYTDY